MIEPNPDAYKDDEEARIWSVLTNSVQRLEESWETGSPRTIASLLPDSDSDFRRRVLLELVKVDQELRWRAGDPKTTEAYLAEWPELTSDPEVLGELLEAECLTRAVFEDLPSTEELRWRFPDTVSHIDLSGILERTRHEANGRRRWQSLAAPSVPPDSDEDDITSPLQVGDPFGRYEVRAALGKGGMGWVYLAYDKLLQRDVALKIPWFGGDVNHALSDRFLNESRAAARIEHPNICPIYDAGNIDGIFYLTMRRVRGETLAQRLERGPLQPLVAAQLTHKLASALSAIHSHGILHRDVKTLNILLDEEGEPLLTDFGLARLPEIPVSEPESKPRSSPFPEVQLLVDKAVEASTGRIPECTAESETASSLVGTLHYLAPELIRKLPPDPRSDIYALGVVLYRALTGCLPFRGTPEELVTAIQSQSPPCPSQYVSTIPPVLESVCLKCLAKEPGDRYQSAAEMAAALRQYMYPEEKAAQERRVAKVRGKMWSAIAIAGLTIVATITCFVGPGSITLDPIDPGARVLMDGKEVEIPPGQRSLTISAGFGPHKLVVSGPTFLERTVPCAIPWRGAQQTLSAGALVRSIDAGPGGRSVAALCGSPDGSIIYAAYSEYPNPSPVRAFEASTGKSLNTYSFPDISYDHKGIAVSTDGLRAFVTNFHERSGPFKEPLTYDRTDISRIDLKHQGELTSLDVGGLWATDIAATSDGHWLVVSLGGDNRNDDWKNDALAIVDIGGDEFKLAARVPLEDEPGMGMLALAPDDRAAYVVTLPRKSHTPKLYEVQLALPIQVTRSYEFRIKNPQSVPDLRSVAISSELGRIYVADAAFGEGIRVLDREKWEEIEPLELPRGYIPSRLALHAPSELLAVLCKDSHTIFLFDLRSARLLAKIPWLAPRPDSMVFSPDGKQIWVAHGYPNPSISILEVNRSFGEPTVVFVSDRDREGKSLHCLNATGTSATPIESHHGQDSSVRWSPDGKRIAFVSTRNGQSHIYISDEFARRVQCLTSTRPPTESGSHCLDWSPDGTRIVFVAYNRQELHVVDVTTGEVKRIDSGPFAEHYNRHASVSWNRASNLIFFSSMNSASANDYHDIFTLDPESGSVKRVTDHRGKNYFLATPVVSPNGDRIAAVYCKRDLEKDSEPLYLLRPDAMGQELVPGTEGQFCGPPNWSADGKYLYYAASINCGGQRDIYRVPLDGGSPEQLTSGDEDDLEPDVSRPR